MGSELDELTRLYMAGEPLKAIAASAGLPVGTIVSRLRRAGVPSRRNLRRERALAELPELAAAGATFRTAAQRFGVNSETASKWARSAGVTLARSARPRRGPTPIDPTLVERYLAGERVRTLAAEGGISPRALRGRFARAGVRRPRPTPPTCPRCGNRCSSHDVEACRACRRPYPPPEPRVCALDGCDRVFTPAAEKLARGGHGGHYCSLRHAYDARKGKVPPQLARARTARRRRRRRRQ